MTGTSGFDRPDGASKQAASCSNREPPAAEPRRGRPAARQLQIAPQPFLVVRSPALLCSLLKVVW